LASLSHALRGSDGKKQHFYEKRRKRGKWNGTMFPSCCAGHAPLESDQEPSLLRPGRNPGSTLQLRHRPMTQLDYPARRAIECSRYVAAIPRRLVIPLASTMPKSVGARGGVVSKTVHANDRSAKLLSRCISVRIVRDFRLTFAAAFAIRADNRRRNADREVVSTRRAFI